MVGERISTATEMIMAHLPIKTRICHASQKRKRWAVGEKSLPVDITRARDFSRRMEDEIEMIQYLRPRPNRRRSRCDPRQQYRPGCGRGGRPPSALSKGKGRSEDTAGTCDMEPVSKRAGVTEAQAQCSRSAVAIKGRFTPLTPEIEKAGGRTQYDEVRPGFLRHARQMTKGEARPA
jgi:hypothetical protein